MPTHRRSNSAQNSREQFPLIQASVQEQIPMIQPPASTLSPLLEISPLFLICPQTSSMTSFRSVLPLFHIQCHHLRFRNFPSHILSPQFLLFNLTLTLSLVIFLSSFITPINCCWNTYLTLFLSRSNDRVIVSITGSTCLFSVHISHSHRSFFFPSYTILIFSSFF